MFPFLLDSSWLIIHSYLIALFLSATVSYYVLLSEKDAKKFKIRKLKRFFLGSYFFGLLGARIFFILTHLYFYLEFPEKILTLWEGGFSFSGAMLGVLLFTFYFIKKHGFGFWAFGDLCAPSITMGLAILKLGCFSAGCCYGLPTDSFLGMHFPTHPEKAILPIQLFEFISFFIFFFFLRFYKFGITQPGNKLLIFLMGFGIIKSIFTFMRGDFMDVNIQSLLQNSLLFSQKTYFGLYFLIFIVAFILFVLKNNKKIRIRKRKKPSKYLNN